jgi:hypothetical protein
MDRNAKIARLRKLLPAGRNTRKFLRSRYVMNELVPMSNADLREQMKYYKGSKEAFWNEVEETVNTSNASDRTNEYLNNGYNANSNNNHNGGKRRKTHRRKSHKRRTHRRRN